jgi:hypothetical protein
MVKIEAKAEISKTVRIVMTKIFLKIDNSPYS